MAATAEVHHVSASCSEMPGAPLLGLDTAHCDSHRKPQVSPSWLTTAAFTKLVPESNGCGLCSHDDPEYRGSRWNKRIWRWSVPTYLSVLP